MKRWLFVLGSILVLAGASGLVVFGSAIVGTVEDLLTYRVVNPPNPLPASLAELRWVAISGMAFAFGLGIFCVATITRDAQTTLSFRGKFLHVAAGVLLLLGTVPLLWGIVGARSDFRAIATSATPPTPEAAREMYQSAAPTLKVGSVVLLAGAVILLVAGQVGLRATPPPANETRSMLGVLAATGCMLLAVVSSLLFAGVWFHGSGLEAILADSASGTPKPFELARHLTGILSKSLLAFTAVGCQAVMQVLAAAFGLAKPS